MVKTLPSIDWSHVHEKFTHMATDSDGVSWLYEGLPELVDNGWYLNMDGDVAEAQNFKSYKPGNVDWKDSLVKREKAPN